MTVNQWESISSKNQSRHNKGAHNRTDSIGSKVEILSRLREQMIGKEICTELWYFTVAQSANGKQYKWVTNVTDQKKVANAEPHHQLYINTIFVEFVFGFGFSSIGIHFFLDYSALARVPLCMFLHTLFGWAEKRFMVITGKIYINF